MSTPLASQMFAQQQMVAPAMTDDQIATALGMSKSLVFQLRMRAMAKIRAAVLADDELRDTVEELTGRRLPPVTRCEADDCGSIDDVRHCLTRVGRVFDTPQRLCKPCRVKMNGKVRLAKGHELRRDR